MLCFALTSIVLPNDDPTDLDVRHLTPTHLRCGAMMDEPCRGSRVSRASCIYGRETAIRDLLAGESTSHFHEQSVQWQSAYRLEVADATQAQTSIMEGKGRYV